MKRKLKKLVLKWIVFGFTFILFYGCQKDLYENQHHSNSTKILKVRCLKGSEKLMFENLLKEKLRGVRLDETARLTSNYGSIDYSKIIEVVDTLGLKNYTFATSTDALINFKFR